MKILVVIPARYQSTRFPAKVLAKDTGKYLLQHTYEQVIKADLIDDTVVAADDEKISNACAEFGAKCILTSTAHQSGTDRIAEAAAKVHADIIINVQADEPELKPANINLLAKMMLDSPAVEMATLISRFESKEQIANPNIVKAIIGQDRFAIYFSRSVMPYCRDSGGIGDVKNYYRHLGIYAYRNDFLRMFTKLPQGKLEQLEKLEQLRAIEYGHKILTGLVNHFADGIDTPQQYQEFVKRYKNGRQK